MSLKNLEISRPILFPNNILFHAIYGKKSHSTLPPSLCFSLYFSFCSQVEGQCTFPLQLLHHTPPQAQKRPVLPWVAPSESLGSRWPHPSLGHRSNLCDTLSTSSCCSLYCRKEEWGTKLASVISSTCDLQLYAFDWKKKDKRWSTSYSALGCKKNEVRSWPALPHWLKEKRS